MFRVSIALQSRLCLRDILGMYVCVCVCMCVYVCEEKKEYVYVRVYICV